LAKAVRYWTINSGGGDRQSIFWSCKPVPIVYMYIYIGVNARIKILKLEAQRVNNSWEEDMGVGSDVPMTTQGFSRYQKPKLVVLDKTLYEMFAAVVVCGWCGVRYHVDYKTDFL